MCSSDLLIAIAICSQPLSVMAGLLEDITISHPAPHYPAFNLLSHQGATIFLRVTVKNGKIADVRAVSGLWEFTDPSVRWVKLRWKFKPGINGTYTFPIYFRSLTRK